MPAILFPPINISSTVSVRVFCSSSAYLLNTRRRAPAKFWGQWQFSQVSRAGEAVSFQSRRDRFRGGSKHGLDELPHSVRLAAEPPCCTRSHMTLHAFDLGMRRVLVGREF